MIDNINCCINNKIFCLDQNCKFCNEKSVISWVDISSIIGKNTEELRKYRINTKNKFDLQCGICNTIYYGRRIDHYISRKANFCKPCHVEFENSMSSHEKSKYWSDKNKLKPHQVKKCSNIEYLFDCPCGHEIPKSPNSINRGEWCPYCSIPTQKLCKNECHICYPKSFASHPKSIYWSSKNNITTNLVAISSDKKYLFNCDKCKHEFPSLLRSITSGSWCPYCSIPTTKICDDLNCDHCFNRSFASHPKAIFWSEKNDIKPRNVCKHTKEKYLFKCEVCDHDFPIALSNLCIGKWCSYCNGDKLCNDISCKWCYEHSLSSIDKEFINENTRKIRKGTNKKITYKCKNCNHIYSKNHNSDGCSYCSHKILCINENCIFCYKASFASRLESKFWSTKNNLSPRQIIKNSKTKVWLNCEFCHQDYPKFAYSKSGCRCQKNKTEKKLYDYLICNYPQLEMGFRAQWCKNIETNQYLPFDFVILDYNIIIELDGRQHFEQVMKWKSPDEQRIRDLYKMKCANDNKYSVIRIIQEDVYNDKNDWTNKLTDAIKNIHSKNEIFNVFICNNNEYKLYI